MDNQNAEIKNESLMDVPPIKGISEVAVEVKDIRIPSSKKDTKIAEEAKASFKAEDFPENYITPDKDEWKTLVGIWLENKKAGMIMKGSRSFNVILPEGTPIFVPIIVNLDNAYGSLSGGSRR